MQKRERKGEKQKRKEAKEAKNYTHALGEFKCAYTKKKRLKFRIEQSKLEAFWISELRELNILGPSKFALQPGKRKEFLLLVLYECTSQCKQKRVIEIVRKKAVFIKVDNLYLFKF